MGEVYVASDKTVAVTISMLGHINSKSTVHTNGRRGLEIDGRAKIAIPRKRSLPARAGHYEVISGRLGGGACRAIPVRSDPMLADSPPPLSIAVFEDELLLARRVCGRRVRLLRKAPAIEAWSAC
jgi:hypothetical protein